MPVLPIRERPRVRLPSSGKETPNFTDRAVRAAMRRVAADAVVPALTGSRTIDVRNADGFGGWVKQDSISEARDVVFAFRAAIAQNDHRGLTGREAGDALARNLDNAIRHGALIERIVRSGQATDLEKEVHSLFVSAIDSHKGREFGTGWGRDADWNDLEYSSNLAQFHELYANRQITKTSAWAFVHDEGEFAGHRVGAFRLDNPSSAYSKNLRVEKAAEALYGTLFRLSRNFAVPDMTSRVVTGAGGGVPEVRPLSLDLVEGRILDRSPQELSANLKWAAAHAVNKVRGLELKALAKQLDEQVAELNKARKARDRFMLDRWEEQGMMGEVAPARDSEHVNVSETMQASEERRAQKERDRAAKERDRGWSGRDFSDGPNEGDSRFPRLSPQEHIEAEQAGMKQGIPPFHADPGFVTVTHPGPPGSPHHSVSVVRRSKQLESVKRQTVEELDDTFQPVAVSKPWVGDEIGLSLPSLTRWASGHRRSEGNVADAQRRASEAMEDNVLPWYSPVKDEWGDFKVDEHGETVRSRRWSPSEKLWKPRSSMNDIRRLGLHQVEALNRAAAEGAVPHMSMMFTVSHRNATAESPDWETSIRMHRKEAHGEGTWRVNKSVWFSSYERLKGREDLQGRNKGFLLDVKKQLALQHGSDAWHMGRRGSGATGWNWYKMAEAATGQGEDSFDAVWQSFSARTVQILDEWMDEVETPSIKGWADEDVRAVQRETLLQTAAATAYNEFLALRRTFSVHQKKMQNAQDMAILGARNPQLNLHGKRSDPYDIHKFRYDTDTVPTQVSHLKAVARLADELEAAGVSHPVIGTKGIAARRLLEGIYETRPELREHDDFGESGGAWLAGHLDRDRGRTDHLSEESAPSFGTGLPIRDPRNQAAMGRIDLMRSLIGDDAMFDVARSDMSMPMMNYRRFQRAEQNLSSLADATSEGRQNLYFWHEPDKGLLSDGRTGSHMEDVDSGFDDEFSVEDIVDAENMPGGGSFAARVEERLAGWARHPKTPEEDLGIGKVARFEESAAWQAKYAGRSFLEFDVADMRADFYSRSDEMIGDAIADEIMTHVRGAKTPVEMASRFLSANIRTFNEALLKEYGNFDFMVSDATFGAALEQMGAMTDSLRTMDAAGLTRVIDYGQPGMHNKIRKRMFNDWFVGTYGYTPDEANVMGKVHRGERVSGSERFRAHRRFASFVEGAKREGSLRAPEAQAEPAPAPKADTRHAKARAGAGVQPDNVTLVEGSIFDSDADIIVNPVNTRGTMGKGLARQYRDRFPGLQEHYQSKQNLTRLVSSRIDAGGTFTDSVTGRDRNIVNFATKSQWSKPSEMEYITRGLANLHRALKKDGRFESVALPALGSGLGGLDFNDVLRAINTEFAGSEIQVQVYRPKKRVK